MGVRGLTTYINKNQDVFLKKHYLHDTKLIIDGLSLCSQLYCSINSFSAFGGDYDKYAVCVRTFFKNLRKCNIIPFVIFDGCHEEKKLRTVLFRLRSKLSMTSKLDPVTQGSLTIFPYLLRDVFKEVLIELEIRFTVCEHEADDDIASMARHLNCPVLSYDSDFYIYNVLYIPYNMLEQKPKPMEEDGRKFQAMECKMYKVEYLCKHFGGFKKELLPLLATLLGNDYVEKKVFQKFFSQLKLQKSKKNQNEQQRSIHALFNWLQNESLDTAIVKILGRLKKNQKGKVYETIRKSVEGYHRQSCESLKYFNIKDDPVQTEILTMPEIEDTKEDSDNEIEGSDSLDDTDIECNLTEEDKSMISSSDNNSDVLPEWFVEKMRQNKIPTVYLNLYALHLQICNPQVEDFADTDSFLCTLPIVRYAFDILTDFTLENFLYVSRENSQYKKIFVGKEYAIQRPLNIPFKDLNQDQLKLYFQHFVKLKLPDLDETVIEVLPSNFQLIMMSILWWISTCSVPLSHVHSIIMSYLVLEVIDEKTGMARGDYHFNNKHHEKIQQLKKRSPIDSTYEDLFLNKNKVQYEDCLLAASVLLKHFEIDASILKRPKTYDREKIHSFAKFQCILHQLNSLNILCNSPFGTTTYSKSYNGTFVYNIALKLEDQGDPMVFVEDFLQGATTVIQFYKGILILFNRLIEKMKISTVQWSKRRKRKGNNKNVDTTVKKFESDVII